MPNDTTGVAVELSDTQEPGKQAILKGINRLS